MRDLRDLAHRLDHVLGVAGLRVGLLEDLLGAARGLADRRADLLERDRDRVHVVAALGDHLAREAHLVGDAARVGLDLVDQLRDLVGAARRALGELADLVGDDREAAARLARARGLDRGVQREQVRARATLVMISVIWWTWRVLLSSWKTMLPACSTRSKTLRIFSSASRETSTPACAFWFASAAKPNASRARAGVELDGRRDRVDDAAHLLEQRGLLRRAARHLADTSPRSPRCRRDTPSTLRVSSCAERPRGRRRLHLRDEVAKAAAIGRARLREVVGLVAEAAGAAAARRRARDRPSRSGPRREERLVAPRDLAREQVAEEPPAPSATNGLAHHETVKPDARRELGKHDRRRGDGQGSEAELEREGTRTPGVSAAGAPRLKVEARGPRNAAARADSFGAWIARSEVRPGPVDRPPGRPRRARSRPRA